MIRYYSITLEDIVLMYKWSLEYIVLRYRSTLEDIVLSYRYTIQYNIRLEYILPPTPSLPDTTLMLYC